MFDETISECFGCKLAELNVLNAKKVAIYGVGDGAKIAYEALSAFVIQGAFFGFIENDNIDVNNRCFLEKPIFHLDDCYADIDVIIIGALQSRKIIKKRLNDFKFNHLDANFDIVDLFAYNTVEEEVEYVHYIEAKLIKERAETFIDISKDSFQRKKDDTKVIAWYLPQYHRIPVNDKFLGKGFTEWTNTTQCLPIFTGHYQPHIPYDVGYYDLNNIETLKRQIELAKMYGIYGFCFHYYWFSGTRLMEKPLFKFIDNPDLDIKFCINWANENWTSLWDAGNNEIIYKQELHDGDCRKFAEDLLPFLSDHRYIKIDEKPVFVIYHANIWNKDTVNKFLDELRTQIKQKLGCDLYILLTNAHGFDENAKEWGADAIVEFPPHAINRFTKNYRPRGYINPNFVGRFLDGGDFIKKREYMMTHNTPIYYRSALTSWDNTARKATTNAAVFTGFTPATFKQWLIDIITESKKIHQSEEDYVFVNSWNEWAEGSHLEPDMKYGYAYLQTVKEALEECRGYE